MIRQICLFIFLFAFMMPAMAFAGDGKVNPAFTQWLKNRNAAHTDNVSDGKDKGRQTDASGSSPNVMRTGGGFVPSVIDRSHLTGPFNPGKNKDGSPKRTAEAIRLGASPTDKIYDLRSILNRMPPIRNQSDDNTPTMIAEDCWAYAAYASLESNLRKNGRFYDFSEFHMATPHGFDWALDEGGNADIAIAYLSRWAGPVRQDTTVPVVRHQQNAYYLPHISEAQYGQGAAADPNFIDNVKDALLSYGPVFVSITSQPQYWSSSNTYYYAFDCSAPTGVDTGFCSDNGHAVSIIGWNDNVPAENFTTPGGHTPLGNGGFIVRNSWGTEVGEQGYFYISYYDTAIGGDTVVFDTPEEDSNYKRAYSYDDYGNTLTVGCTDYEPLDAHNNSTCKTNRGTAWAANIFTADANAIIRAVSFHTTNSNVLYELYIATAVSAGLPRSGFQTLVSSGSMPSAGYHTIPLRNTIKIDKGVRFSAILKIVDNSGFLSPLAEEYRMEGYSSAATAEHGQSYYSHTGTANTWQDITNFTADPMYGRDHSHSNWPIKVFVDEDPTGPYWTSDKPLRDGTSTTEDIYKTENETELSANWDSATDPESGVSGYMVAISTNHGDTYLMPWTDIGLANLHTQTGLTLDFGTTYYFGLKAYNYYRTESETLWSSGQVLLFKRPPQPVFVNDGYYAGDNTGLYDDEYVNASSILSAHWALPAAINENTQSPATNFKYAIGTSRGGNDVKDWTNVSVSPSAKSYRVSATGLSLENGRTYYFSVYSEDAKGKKSDLKISDGQTVFRTVPQINYIVLESTNIAFGGFSGTFLMNVPKERLVDEAAPQFYFTDSANHEGSLDLTYLGDSQWQFDGVISSNTFTIGEATFHFSARTKAGLTGSTIKNDTGTGDKFNIVYTTSADHTPPLWVSGAKVTDGLAALDIASTASTSTLSANWSLAYDYQSGIDRYEYRIGTTKFDYDVYPGRDYLPSEAWVSNGLERSVTVENLPLSYGTTYYFTVRAVNNVGLITEMPLASDGQWVDGAKPGNIPYVYCSYYDDVEYAHWVTTFTAHWGKSDPYVSPERAATSYRYAIGTTPGGQEKKPWTYLDISQNSVLVTALSTLEEKDYYFSIKARNDLGRESDIKTCKITIDRSYPYIVSIDLQSLPQNSGSAIYGTFKVSENSDKLKGTPSLGFKTASSDVYPLTVTKHPGNADYYWDFSGYVELSSLLEGPATFVFEGVDKAGNIGVGISSGDKFTINALRDNAANTLVFENSDGIKAEIPKDTVPGDIKLYINTNMWVSFMSGYADSKPQDSSPIRAVSMPRDFKAYDSADNEINNFSKDITITFPYPDSDGDGKTDGDYFDVDTLFVHYLDEGNLKWIPVPNSTLDRNLKQVSAKVSHFSIYSLRSVNRNTISFNVKPSPNPCRFKNGNVSFKGIPIDATGITVFIYNTAGELVREIPKGECIPTNCEWDGKTQNGSMAATGAYLYLIKTDTHGKSKGKFYAIW